MRTPHKPTQLRRGLFQPGMDWRHPETAAFSLARSRASKIANLYRDGAEDLAQNAADALVHDVCEHIARNDLSADLARNLARTAIEARDGCYLHFPAAVAS